MAEHIDLRDLIGIIARQRSFILGVCVAVLGMVIIAAYSITPVFTATSTIVVDTSGKSLLDPEYRIGSEQSNDAKVESEVQLLMSDKVLLSVIADKELVSDSEFGLESDVILRLYALVGLPMPKPPEAAIALSSVLEKFRKSIRVQRVDRTNIIRLEVSSRSAQKAAALADAVAKAYVADQVSSKISAAVAAKDVLEKRVMDAGNAVADRERALDRYIEETLLDLNSSSPDQIRLHDRLSQIKKEQLKLEAQASLLREGIEAADVASLSKALQSRTAQEISKRRSELQARLQREGLAANEYESLRAALNTTDDQLKNAAKEEVTALGRRAAEFDQRANEARQSLRKSVMEGNLPPETLTEIFSLQQSAEISRKQYQAVLERQQDFDTEASLQVADSRIVSAALPPSRPSFPNKMLFLTIGGMAALCLAIGLAVAREFYVGGFVHEDQIEAVLEVPLATAVPDLGAVATRRTGSISDILVKEPLSGFAESFRKLRLNINSLAFRQKLGRAGDVDGGLVIMITSAVPSEGKTTCAVSLARTLALLNKRALLVDCDLRRPSVHAQLGLPQGAGVSDILLNQPSINQIPGLSVRDESTGLSVIGAGTHRDIATDELFMDERIVRFLAMARRHFDYVVLDTPPILPVVDALYIARHVDLIGFVVRCRYTSQGAARNGIVSLKEHAKPDTPILAILNEQPASATSYGTYYTGAA